MHENQQENIDISGSRWMQRAFAMKQHRATRWHCDLRLEWNGVLISWALPQGPSLAPGLCRQAIEVEDHRRENLLFEGLHRTGPIMLWDFGTWEPQGGFEDIALCLEDGLLLFTLHGERLRGGWALRRVSRTGKAMRKIWYLCKQDDLFCKADRHSCVLKEFPKSILSHRTLDEITRDWSAPQPKHIGQESLFAHSIRPHLDSDGQFVSALSCSTP